MNIKITVMSPLHNVGSSVVSLFITQALTFAHYKTLLLYNQSDSLIPRYLGSVDDGDLTRSVSQLAQLLDAGALDSDHILDYCNPITQNCFFLNTSANNLYQEDKLALVNNIFSSAPVDVTVCDNTEDIGTSTSTLLLEKTDMIFIVVPHSLKGFERLKIWLKNPELRDYMEKIYVVISNYSEEVFAMRVLSKHIGFPNSHVLRMHYNPWIEKMCHAGKLQTVLPLAKELDPRVANLSNDIAELTSCVNSYMFTASKEVL